MGCCFGKDESGENERDPLIASEQSHTYNTGDSARIPVIVDTQQTNDCTSSENAAHSFQFIPIDQNTNQVKDHTDRSAYYKEKFGSFLRDAKVPHFLPNVIDPTTVLILPITGKEELEQVKQSSEMIASLIEQMRPKSKEPITAVTLD